MLYNIFLAIAVVFSLAVLAYIVVDIIRVHVRANRIKKKREEAEAAAQQPDEQPPVDEAAEENQ